MLESSTNRTNWKGLAEAEGGQPHGSPTSGPSAPAAHGGRPLSACSCGFSPWLRNRTIWATFKKCRCPGSPQSFWFCCDSNSDSPVWLNPHLAFKESETLRGKEICLGRSGLKLQPRKNDAYSQNDCRNGIKYVEIVNLG